MPKLDKIKNKNILIVAGALILACAVLLLTLFLNRDYAKISETFYNEKVEQVENSQNRWSDYVVARGYFEERLSQAKNRKEKYYLGYYYTLFLYGTGLNLNDARVAFEAIEEPAKITNNDACDLRALYETLYSSQASISGAPHEKLMEQCEYED